MEFLVLRSDCMDWISPGFGRATKRSLLTPLKAAIHPLLLGQKYKQNESIDIQVLTILSPNISYEHSETKLHLYTKQRMTKQKIYKTKND